MKDMGRIKKVFPGGNTTQGFYSFFDYIIQPDANRIFILKGGPGVGKSSFMKKIGQEMVEKGYDIEEHYCSSSNNSLDAVVIPKLKVAFMDGTAPHMVDPKNPGAVDEIINLGDYWKGNELERNREKVLLTNKEVGKCFRRAYQCLKALGMFIEETAEIYLSGREEYLYYHLENDLVQKIFNGKAHKNKLGFARHLFGSGITPRGVVDYFETIVGSINNIYYVKGAWGTGWSELLDEISKKAIKLGYDVEVYHTPLAPKKISDIVIPALDLAFTTKEKLKNQCKEEIDLDKLIHKGVIEKNKEELEFNNKMYHQLLKQSIKYINKAKLAHDDLEKYYIPNMDFDNINKKRSEIVKRISKYEK